MKQGNNINIVTLISETSGEYERENMSAAK